MFVKWLLKERVGKLPESMSNSSFQSCDLKGSIKTETYGLKSQKTPPPISELAAFENDLIELVKNIKFTTSSTQPVTKNVKIRCEINPTI